MLKLEDYGINEVLPEEREIPFSVLPPPEQKIPYAILKPNIYNFLAQLYQTPLLNMMARENINLWKKERERARTQTPQERFEEIFGK